MQVLKFVALPGGNLTEIHFQSIPADNGPALISLKNNIVILHAARYKRFPPVTICK